MIKSRKVRWAGKVARMRDTRNTQQLVERYEGKNQLTHLGTDGGVLLKWTWNNDARVLPDSSGSE